MSNKRRQFFLGKLVATDWFDKRADSRYATQGQKLERSVRLLPPSKWRVIEDLEPQPLEVYMANQLPNQEYVLKRRPNGRHFQEWAWVGNPTTCAEVMGRISAGTVGGHEPVAGERYGARVFNHPNGRMLVKLTVLRTVTYNPDGSVSTV